MLWNLINLIHGQLAQYSLPLPMLFPQSDLHFYHPLTCIPLNHVFPFTTNYLIGSIYSSTILKENLYHLLMPMECWCVQRSAAILRIPTWSASECWTISISYPLFHIQEIQTQYWLHKSITHLPGCSRKPALSIDRRQWCTNVPKDAYSMACLVKAMLWTTFFVFKKISIAVHT